MINPFAPITGSVPTSNVNSTSSSSASSAPLDLKQTFQQILQLSMASAGSSSDSSEGFNPQSMLMPLMLMLMEQLLERTTEDSSSTQESSQATSSISTAVSNDPNVGGGRILPGSGNSSTPSGRPVGGVVTQYPHSGHMAFDFGVPVGTPVRGTMDGKVIYAGWNDQGYGNLVIVENGPYRTYYAHLSSIPVQLGDQVAAGDTVGLSGNTGNSTGPHLHYEVRYNMQAVDPTPFTL